MQVIESRYQGDIVEPNPETPTPDETPQAPDPERCAPIDIYVRQALPVGCRISVGQSGGYWKVKTCSKSDRIDSPWMLTCVPVDKFTGELIDLTAIKEKLMEPRPESFEP